MGGDVRNRLQYLLCAPMSVMRSALLVTVVFFHEDYESGNRLAISCVKKVLEVSDLKSSDAWNVLF